MARKRDVGMRLMWYRRRKGLTQEVVGAKLGVSKAAVSRWETGVREASYDQLMSLARLYGVEVGDFFRHGGDSPPEGDSLGEVMVTQEVQTLPFSHLMAGVLWS